MHAEELLGEYPLVSDQVSRQQVASILRELEIVLENNVAGAIVEFGCYIGTTSLFIRRLLDTRGEGSQHEFHVYDSFEGLPPKTMADNSSVGEQFVGGELAVSKRQFMNEFLKARLDLPFMHKKWFAELAEHDVPKQICFAFLDGDFYESIRDSLQLVLPCLQPGATLVLDDYAREALPGVAKAVHEFVPRDLQSKIRVEYNLGIIRT
jgi:O-methyltransferase